MRRAFALAVGLGACTPPDEEAPIAPVAIRENPNGPLSPFVIVDAPEGAVVTVEVAGPAGAPATRPTSWDGAHHVAWVWGLRPETDYEVTAIVDGEPWAPIPLATEGLPFALPRSSLVVDEAGRDGGLTLFATHVDGEILILGYDIGGDVVWYHDAGPSDSLGTTSVQPLPDGNLLLLLPGELRVITPDGAPVWSRELPYHHDAIVRPDGHLLLLDQRVERYDVPALGGPVDVMIDGVVEYDAAGERLGEWWASEDLDVQRFDSALSRTAELGNGGIEWGHANALVQRDDGLLLISLRHQSWIVGLDWTTKDPRWVLGNEGDFSIADPDDWFDSQHAPEPMPDGSMYIYDNGVERSPPYTRVMRMALDEERRVASLVWSFRLPVFTVHAGDVDVLPNGNLLVTAGEPSQLSQKPRIFEVNSANTVLWQLEVDGPPIYRATRIAGF